MKKNQPILMALGLGAALLCFAQTGELVKPTPAKDARSVIGTNAVVVGRVAEVHKNDKIIRLNFEEKYPKQVFTAVVFAKNFNIFTNLEALSNQTVEVSGKVTEFKGRPEMILNSKGQLRVP
ncbi:MAG: hypothetical protein WCO56_00350 [Verrucomicrobiota bacterium]